MRESRIQKLLAYIYVPVIFTVIGYFLLAVALNPFWEMASSAVSMFRSEEGVEFDQKLTSIYDPDAAAAAQVVNETPEAGEETQEAPYIRIADVDFPVAGAHYANLYCDRIGLEAPVYWNDNNEILRNGVGQYLASFLPGFGRLIVLSGHNTTYFRPLKEIKEGDVVRFDTNYCDYEYEITEVKVMNEDDLQRWILDHVLEEKETLLMYSCWPFEVTVGRKTDRLTVFGKRIKGYDVKWRNLDE